MHLFFVLLMVVQPAIGPLKLPKLFSKTFTELRDEKPSTPTSRVYVSKTEVSNLEYREFLYHAAHNHPAEYNVFLPDTLQWETIGAEPLTSHYHVHQAYSDYPVVNISYEAAIAYCAWLTAFNREQGLFAQQRGYQVTYRLPTQEEWVRAARGGNDSARYAWESARKPSKRDEAPANFLVDHELDNASITFTSPVKSYAPNGYSIYNMSGNVAELLALGEYAAGGHWASTVDDVATNSFERFTGPSPFVGFRVVAEITVP